MDVISRAEARERGLKFYFTGKPCKYGHVAQRRITSKHCDECRNAYLPRKKDLERKRRKDLSAGELLRTTKSNAKKRGIGFELSLQDIESIVKIANGNCQLTGIPFNNDLVLGGRRPFRPSLDRKDSSQSYVRANMQLVCAYMNQALSNQGEQLFELFAAAYLRHNGYNVT